jgi:hypothetical protein
MERIGDTQGQQSMQDVPLCDIDLARVHAREKPAVPWSARVSKLFWKNQGAGQTSSWTAVEKNCTPSLLGGRLNHGKKIKAKKSQTGLPRDYDSMVGCAR